MGIGWSRPRTAGLVLVLVAAVAGGVVLVRDDDEPTCGAERVGSPTSPLQSAELMRQRPDEDRDRTVAALDAMGPPFGPVVAGRDYYYDQFLRLYGVPGGVLAWTKNAAPVTYLDDAGLVPRWSLKPTAQRTAWDVSADHFLLLDLADDAPVTAALFDLGSGTPRWCTALSSRHADGDLVASTFLDGGDVVTAFQAGQGVRFTRLSAVDGSTVWEQDLVGSRRTDFLGQVTADLVVAGGDEEYRLAKAPSATDGIQSSYAGPVLGFDLGTGERSWSWAPNKDGVAHIVGAHEGTVLVSVRTPFGSELVQLSATGQENWRRPVIVNSDSTLRDGLVLLRGRSAIEAYDATTGERRWRRAIPTDKPYIPLGFTLAQMPSVDDGHLLLPTVSSLELLDLTDGTSASYPMPTDGLSSDHFAYQLLATEQHLGVVTNTGAVVAARE